MPFHPSYRCWAAGAQRSATVCRACSAEDVTPFSHSYKKREIFSLRDSLKREIFGLRKDVRSFSFTSCTIALVASLSPVHHIAPGNVLIQYFRLSLNKPSSSSSLILPPPPPPPMNNAPQLLLLTQSELIRVVCGAVLRAEEICCHSMYDDVT